MTLQRFLLILVILLASWGCDEVDPEIGRQQGADGAVYSDAALDSGRSLPADVTPDAFVPPGCVHDAHCTAFGMVCDLSSGVCVECLTDQNCPQEKFCLDQTCWVDVCKPGETRCYGKEQVAMCAANGGSWLPTDCPKGQLCQDGKCRPPPCKPGAMRCDGTRVMRCRDDGSGEDEEEDCADTEQVCINAQCKPKGCSKGQIACADEDTALLCVDPKKGWTPETCNDGDACTFDLCKAGTGCSHPPKPDGMACGIETWCMSGQCTNVVNNLVVVFDTSGSMTFKVPGKICYDQKWPDCTLPNQACDRMGVSKNIFRKAFANVDPSKTRIAMFRFPQLWLPPEATTSPKPPYFKPPVACANGYYLGYGTMTGHTVEEGVGPDTKWYWDNLGEVLCVPYPVTPDHDPSAEIESWMDGEEEYGVEPELRAIGGTPIGRTLFYVGEYLRNKVVIDGKPCNADGDCQNPNYFCDAGACRDPARECRQTTVVVFTDGGENNWYDKFFSPWVQAKRLAYGLTCSTDADCASGARCLCPLAEPGCAPSALRCMPEGQDTGFFCRSTMQPCLPTANEGAPGYCPKKNGQNQCVEDPVANVAATSSIDKKFDVLRSPDGKPFGVKVHVVDISNDGNGVERSGNLARAGNGLLLAPDGADENAFLASLTKAFDVQPKPSCGVGVLPCGKAGFSASCDDGNACTNDACNQTTGTCSHVANTAPCDDGNACTLSDRCLDGDCRPGIGWVESVAGNGLSQPGLGKATVVGLPDPRGALELLDGRVLVSDGNRIVALQGDQLVTFAGSGKAGKADGPAAAASFLLPAGMDRDGTTVYVADTGNRRIRTISETGEGLVVATLAGSNKGFADGPAATAAFDEPLDVAVDHDGSVLVADRDNHRLRRVQAGVVSTVFGDGLAQSVDGAAGTARLAYPVAVARGAPGVQFVAERYRIRRLSNDYVVTVAGGQPGFYNAVGTKAQFDEIASLAVRGDSGLIVVDGGNHAIREVSPVFAVTTLAGSKQPGWVDGFAGGARFWGPRGVSLGAGGRVWIADFDNHRLRMLQLPVVACPDGGPCNAGVCDPATGACKTLPKPDGESCDLGPCLEDETCAGLLCQGGTAKDCDDGEVCTADACHPDSGSCLHTPIAGSCDDGSACTNGDACKAGACVGIPLNCDDGVDTTTDLCEAGQCLHRVGPCSKDFDCYDGESLCSKDRCEAGQCVYEPTGAEGCCTPGLWRVDFADGTPGDLQLVATLGPGKGWQTWTSKGAPGEVAVLYYGDPALASYDLHPDGHGGTALRAALQLPPGRKATARLRLWIDTERAALYDELILRARRSGVETVLWQKGPKTPMKQWFEVEVPLDAFAGRVIDLELGFRTIDGIENSGLGVLVDWFEVVAACGQ